jgi:hypothetical protein
LVDAMLPRKAPSESKGNRTKTDTGRMVEDTKARERNHVKELGNLTP